MNQMVEAYGMSLKNFFFIYFSSQLFPLTSMAKL